MSTNFQHLFHTLDAVCASTCFKIRSPVGQLRVCIPHSGTLRDHAIHGRPQLIFNRLDRSTRFAKSSSGMSMRKSRVLMSTILFIVFTCFFRSPNMCSVLAYFHSGVFLHSRDERSGASCSFVVPCSNTMCSLMLRHRFGLGRGVAFAVTIFALALSTSSGCSVLAMRFVPHPAL